MDALIDDSEPKISIRRPSTNWRRSIHMGYLLIFGVLGSVVAWGSVAHLDGAVVAQGVLSAESSRKTLQHLEGGIVREILVRDGERVSVGQPLIRLDLTRIEFQGDMYGNQLAILLAQEARMLAEFDAKDTITFPDAVLLRQNDAAVAPVIADQTRLFNSRRTALLSNIDIADSLIQQSHKESEQLDVDLATTRATLVQIDAELGALRPLFQKQLVATTRIAPLERERVRLLGLIDSAQVQMLRLREKQSELTLRKQQVRQAYRQEASTALQEVRRSLTDLRQQVLLVSDTRKRSEIRAPTAGVVQQMRYFTVGGVIPPGAPILDIAPDNEDLVIRARVDPNDIDRVRIGTKAEIRFSSFGYWGRNVVRGVLRSVSKDRITEDGGNVAYFLAEVSVDRDTLPADMKGKLSAGMNADVLLITGERSIGEYLINPVLRRWNFGLRER